MNLKELDLPPGADKIANPELAKTVQSMPINPFYTDYENKPSYLGRGSFGNVFSVKGGSEVVKMAVWAETPDSDGYIKFLKYCMANYGNLYLPKIYGIKYFKIEKDDRKSFYDRYFYYVNMEPLTRLDTLSPHQQWALLNNLIELPEDFTPDTADKIVDSWGNTAAIELLNSVVCYIEDTLYGRKPESTVFPSVKIKDTGLLNTIQDLRKYVVALTAAEKEPGIDVKLANLMARITPYGAQLVITDPFS